jgi:protease-4
MRFARMLWVGGLGLVLSARVARADPLPVNVAHVVLPGRGVAADDTSEAIVLNPANLAWLPAPELRWTWIQCPDVAVKTGCGHAWEAATPLLFGLSTAFRIDLVEPPWGAAAATGAGFPFRGFDYVWATWGLAGQIGEHASFGVSIERS